MADKEVFLVQLIRKRTRRLWSIWVLIEKCKSKIRNGRVLRAGTRYVILLCPIWLLFCPISRPFMCLAGSMTKIIIISSSLIYSPWLGKMYSNSIIGPNLALFLLIKNYSSLVAKKVNKDLMMSKSMIFNGKVGPNSLIWLRAKVDSELRL